MKIFTLTACWGRQHRTQTLSPHRASICLLFHLEDLFKKEPCWDHIGLAPSFWKTTITLKTSFSCSKLRLLSVIRPSVSCIRWRRGLQLLPSLPCSRGRRLTSPARRLEIRGEDETFWETGRVLKLLLVSPAKQSRGSVVYTGSWFHLSQPGVWVGPALILLSKMRMSIGTVGSQRESRRPAHSPHWHLTLAGILGKRKKKKDLSGDWWCRPALMSQACSRSPRR